MLDHEKIIDKVQKLLRLSQSSNANEAASAAEKAQELIERYKLEDAQLTEHTATSEPIEDAARSGEWLDEGVATWRKTLAGALAGANQCICYSSGSKVSIVGRRSDSQIVRYMYSYLVEEIRRLARIYGDELGGSYRTSFKKGAVRAISERLRDARKKVADEMRATHSTALVVVDQRGTAVSKWVEVNLNLHFAKARRTRVDADGYEDGIEAGKRVNLGGNQALGSGAKRLRD